MRLVALLIVPLLACAALPATAEPLNIYDQCADKLDPAAEDNCLRVEPVRRVPQEMREPAGEWWFLWLGAPTPMESSNVMTGLPSVVPILYGDTNGLEGLQRTLDIHGGMVWPADDAILV